MPARIVAQPAAYSVADDDISDLGAMTADSAWIYNQLGANLSGILVVQLGLGLWRALSPDVAGRVGAAVLVAEGISTFFDGVFRLDCRGIDAACDNVSWHAHAHKIESGFTGAFALLAPLVLAFAFRRNARWRDSWAASLAVIPAIIAANVAFSARWATGPRLAQAPPSIFCGLRSSARGSCRRATSPRSRRRPRPAPIPATVMPELERVRFARVRLPHPFVTL